MVEVFHVGGLVLRLTIHEIIVVVIVASIILGLLVVTVINRIEGDEMP